MYFHVYVCVCVCVFKEQLEADVLAKLQLARQQQKDNVLNDIYTFTRIFTFICIYIYIQRLDADLLAILELARRKQKDLFFLVFCNECSASVMTIHIHIYVYIRICVYIYVYAFVCICVLCIYARMNLYIQRTTRCRCAGYVGTGKMTAAR